MAGFKCLLFLQLVFIIQIFVEGDDSLPCAARRFDQDSIVCVCNATYCDTITPNDNSLIFTYYQAYQTTKVGDRMKFSTGSILIQQSNDYAYEVGLEMNQTILGFGGAFTDAATMTMDKLSNKTRNNLIESYFGANGIQYTIGRIPMASCDFSSRLYSYDNFAGDFNLTLFKLAEEDLQHKIPAIKDAMRVSTRNISLFGSPWSCPYWMKTNGNMTGIGQLKGQPGDMYHKTWAQYFVKFLQAYKEQGVYIWGLTAQNEPSDGYLPFITIQTLGWTPELQRDFIAKDLGPALHAAGFGDVKLMILDDQRVFLPKWAQIVLADPEAARYVSGIAVHWYEDRLVPTSALDQTFAEFGENFFILNTEACEQNIIDKSKSVELGNWGRAEHYFTDILQDLEHGVSGWVDWNMALNMQGGPNWVNNFADSPIIVNSVFDEFYKQPMFYAMGHFSKFVTPGSRLLTFSKNFTQNDDVQQIFFQREDKSVVANFINTNPQYKMGITIDDPTVPGVLNYDLPPSSMVTFLWFRGTSDDDDVAGMN